MSRLVKISKNGCVPCQVLSNYLNDKGVSFEELNVSTSPELIETYDITGVPVLILLDDNDQEVDRVVGFNPDATDDLLSKL